MSGQVPASAGRMHELLQTEPIPRLGMQHLYEAIHAWALRGMGYGLGDHPETSGERGVLEVLAKRCERPVVFDVGANVGDYAMMVLQRFASNVTLTCFEPSASAIQAFRDRSELARALNPLGSCDVMLQPYGLSDEQGSASLHTDTPGSGMASIHHRRLAHFGRALNVEEKALFRRLDDVCCELGVTRIDLLKLDVEGHELAVLRGAGDMLTSGAIRMIQWEMGGCNLDSRTSFQDFFYMLHENYDLFRVVADGLAPIPQYREQLEVFICANFVAIWRER